MIEDNQQQIILKKSRICNTDFWKMSIPEFIRFYELANFGDDIQEEFSIFSQLYPYIYQGVIRAFCQDGSQEYEYCFAIDLDIYGDDRPLVIPYEVYRWAFQMNYSAEVPFELYSDSYVQAVKIFIISRKFKIFLKSSINILYYLCQHIFRDFDTIDIQDIDLKFYWMKAFSFYSEAMLYGIHAKDKPNCIQAFMPVLLLYPSNFQSLINSHPWTGIKPIIDEFVYLGVYEKEELKKIYRQEDIDYPLIELINPDIVLSAYTMENLKKLYNWVFNGKLPFSAETLQFMQQIQDSANRIEKIHTDSIYQSPSYNSGGLNNPEIQNHYYQFWPLQMSDNKLSRWISWVNKRKQNNQYKSKVGEPFEIPEARFTQKRLINLTPHLILGTASVPRTWDELMKVSYIKTFRFTPRPFPYRTKYSTSRDWNFVPVPDQPIEPFKDLKEIPDLSVESPYYEDFSSASSWVSFTTRFDIIREFGDFYHEKFGHELLVECSYCDGVYLFSYHPSLENYNKKYVCVYNRSSISRAQFNSKLMLLFFHKDPDYIAKNLEYFEMEKEDYIFKFDALKVSSCLKEEPLFAYPLEYLFVSMEQLRKMGLDVDLIFNDVLINNIFNKNFYQSHDYNDSIQKYYKYNADTMTYEETELIEHILPEEIKKIINLEKTGFRVPVYMKALAQHKFAREQPELFEKYVEYMNRQKIQDEEYEDENEYEEKDSSITFGTPSAKITSYPIKVKVFASFKTEEGKKKGISDKINLVKTQFFYEEYREIEYLANLLKEIIFNLTEKNSLIGQNFTLNTMIHSPVVSKNLNIDPAKQYTNTSPEINSLNISIIPGEMFFIYSFHDSIFTVVANGSKTIIHKFNSEIDDFQGSNLHFSIIPMNFNISIQQLKKYNFFQDFSNISQIPEKSHTIGFSRNFLYNYLIKSGKISEELTFEDTTLGTLQSIMHKKARSCSKGMFKEFNEKFNEALKEFVTENIDKINSSGYSISDIISNASYFFSTFVSTNNIYSKIREISRKHLEKFKNYYDTFEFLIAHGLFEFPEKIMNDDEEKIKKIEDKLKDPSEYSKYSVFLKNPFIFMGQPHNHPYPSPNINEYKYRLLFIDRLEKIERILEQDSNGILSKIKSINDNSNNEEDILKLIKDLVRDFNNISEKDKQDKLNSINKKIDEYVEKKLVKIKEVYEEFNYSFIEHKIESKVAEFKESIKKNINNYKLFSISLSNFQKYFKEYFSFVRSDFTKNAFEYMLVIGGMLRKFKEYVNNGEIDIEKQNHYELFLLMLECNFLLNQYYMIAVKIEMKPINKDIQKLASLFLDIPLSNLDKCFQQDLNRLGKKINELKEQIFNEFKENENLRKLDIFNLDLEKLDENKFNEYLKSLDIESPLINDYIKSVRNLIEKDIDSVQKYLKKQIKTLREKLFNSPEKDFSKNIESLKKDILTIDIEDIQQLLDKLFEFQQEEKGKKEISKSGDFKDLLICCETVSRNISLYDIIITAYSKEKSKITAIYSSIQNLKDKLNDNKLKEAEKKKINEEIEQLNKDLQNEKTYYANTFGSFDQIKALLSHFYQSHYINCNLQPFCLGFNILKESIFENMDIEDFQLSSPPLIFMGGKCPVEIMLPDCVQKELKDYKNILKEEDKPLFNFAIKRITNRALEYFIHNSLMLNKANLMYELDPSKIHIDQKGLGRINEIISSGKKILKAAESSFKKIEIYEKKITDFLSSTDVEDSQLINFIANGSLPWQFNRNRVRALRNRYDKPSVVNNQYQYSNLGTRFNRREFAKTFLKFHGFVCEKIKKANLKDEHDLQVVLKFLKDNRLTPLLLFKEYLDKIKACFYLNHISIIKEISVLLNNSTNTSPPKDDEEKENKENKDKAKNLQEDLLMTRYGIRFAENEPNPYQGSTLYILKLLALIYYSKIKRLNKSKEQKKDENAEDSEEIDEYESIDESKDDEKDSEKDKKVKEKAEQNEPKEKGLTKDEIILSKILQILTICDSSLFPVSDNGDKSKKIEKSGDKNKEVGGNNNNKGYLDFLDNLPVILPNNKFQEIFGYQIAEFMSIKENLDRIIEYFGELRYTSYSDISRAIIRYRIAFLFIAQWKKEDVVKNFNNLWEKLKPVSNASSPYNIREKIKNSDFNITSQILKIYATDLKDALKYSNASNYPELKFKFNEKKQCHLLPLNNKEQGIGDICKIDNIAQNITKNDTWNKDLGIEFDLAGHYFPDKSNKDLATFFDSQELEKIHKNKFFSFRPVELNTNNFKRNEKIIKSKLREINQELEADITKTNNRINEVMKQLKILREAEVLIAKIHYFGRGKFKIKIKDNDKEYTEVWNYIAQEYKRIKENLKKCILSNIIPSIPDAINVKSKFMKDMVNFADKLEEILKPEIEKRQNEKTSLFVSIRNLNNKKKGIELYKKKISKQTTNINKINKIIATIFSSTDLKLFRAYLTGSLVIKSTGNPKIVNPSNGIQSNSPTPKQNSLVKVFFADDPQLNEYLKTSFEASKEESQEQESQESLTSSTLSKGEMITPIRVKIRLSSNLFDKIKKGATINNIQILPPKYPSRRCIANVCLAAFSDLARPKPKIMTPPNNAYAVLAKIKDHIKKVVKGAEVFMGIDDNRLNSLYTFSFSFMRSSDLENIFNSKELKNNLLTLNKMIIVDDSKSQNTQQTNSKESFSPIIIKTKDMEQIILACAGIRNLSDEEQKKYNIKRKGAGLSQSNFHPFFDKLQAHVLSKIYKPKVDEPDNPTEQVSPGFSDYLMAFVKYQAEKRDHLKKHIAGLQKKNKLELKNLQKKNSKDAKSLKLELNDVVQQRIFRRKTDKHNYYTKYSNLRKAIDDYISKVLAMTIYLIEPKVIAHEELKFSDKSVEEGGQGGYIKQISQSMFKNFETFSARIKNWFTVEGQQNKYIPEFVPVNATNTSKISFVNRYIKRLPLYLCRFDRTGDADYSYIINPPTSGSNISESVKGEFFEIRCSHEEAAGNILYRGFEKISRENKENKDKSAADKPPPQPSKKIGYVKTGEG